jgi:hypothetical protein
MISRELRYADHVLYTVLISQYEQGGAEEAESLRQKRTLNLRSP